MVAMNILHIATAVAAGAIESMQNLFENTATAMRLPLVRSAPVMPLNGKVAIVTGGNAGIGYATAKKLAERGAHVVLACRSKSRGEQAAKELSRLEPLPGCASPKVEFRHLDLSSLDSVRSFVHRFNRSGRPLDILICNAGVMSPPTRLVTGDGMELQFQVNFLSHFLLSHELLAAQRQRRMLEARCRRQGGHHHHHGTRVLLLSSLTHYAGPVQWHDKLSETSYRPFTSYALSKMCNTMTAFELQRRIARNGGMYGHGDIAVSVHPGIVNTSLATNFFKQTGGAAMPWAEAAAKAALDIMFPLVLRSPEASAEDMLAVVTALAPEVAGRYISNGRRGWPSPFARDEERCADLWDLACRMTGVETHESLR